MLLPWLTLFDFKGVFANFIKEKKLDYRCRYDDFVILVPIFNDVKYLSNVNFLKKYKDKVVLCTTNLESEEFYRDLDKIAHKNNFKVMKCEFDKEVKNPWKIYQKTLRAHDYVLGESLKFFNAKYVIFLDADTISRTDLSYLVGAMEENKLDLASVKVVPSKKSTITENLQYIEYEIAMKSRRIYPWLTSGAAMIGKREEVEKIMKKHSLFFNGGDIEIGKLANLSGLKVGHIPVKFYTDVPETFPKLVKQRFSWFCGTFRHSVINAHTNLFNPIYALYFTLIIFLMLPLKIYELIFHWFVLPPLFLFYMTIIIVSNWEIRNKYMLLFPFYSLFQIIVLLIAGICKYCKTVFQTKNMGFIKKFYKDNYPPLKYCLNILLVIGIAFVIFNIHLVENMLLLGNIDLFVVMGINFSSINPLNVIYNSAKLFMILTGIFFLLMGCFKISSYLKYSFKYRKVVKNFFISLFGFW